MKTNKFFLVTFFLVSFVVFCQPAGAQQQKKTKEEQEKELKIQEEINRQKKELELLKSQQDAAMKEQQWAIDTAMKQARRQIDDATRYKDIERAYRGSGNRPFFNMEPSFDGEPFVFTPGNGFGGFSHSGDNARTSWDFAKSIKENSFSRDYTFDVEQTVNTVVMSVNGDCKAGEIKIKIVMPNGKVYSDILIDEFGNLNWRKSFSISDQENKDKAGAWKFQINASKATGYFKISLQTY